MTRVLLLGGTAEARALAARLHPGVDLISSLAGRVPDPALPVGDVRIGGFGGVDGMRRWLVESEVAAVVDATHPYAATISAHAAEVCIDLRIPHLVLARPAWPSGDAILVGSDLEAAKVIADGEFSRPDLHERIERVLTRTKPDLIIACYGMNDGIYYPFGADRFEKYREGMRYLRGAFSCRLLLQNRSNPV